MVLIIPDPGQYIYLLSELKEYIHNVGKMLVIYILCIFNLVTSRLMSVKDVSNLSAYAELAQHERDQFFLEYKQYWESTTVEQM